MKDHDIQNEVVIAGLWDDFGQFLAEKNWKACEEVINETGDKQFENDAIRMHQLLNKAEGVFTFEPVEEEEIPFLTPEEDDEQVVGIFSENNYDDRFLNSKDI